MPVKREFVLPTPVALFAFKSVQVLAKMSKKDPRPEDSALHTDKAACSYI